MLQRDSFQKARKGKTKRFLITSLMRKSLAYRAMLKRGWSEVSESEDWDYFWADVYAVGQESGFAVTGLKAHQKLNHFPRHTELTRKDALVKNVKRARRALEREDKDSSLYDFLPQTYLLPQEYSIFAEEYRKTQDRVWIMKPCGRSQGDGIFLINKLRQVCAWRKAQASKEQPEPYIISKYIEKPFLVGERKFDLRLYVLVTSFAPLQIYLHSLYSEDTLEDLTVHLTNIAIQKKQGDYDKGTGMKWSLTELRRYLSAGLGNQRTDAVFYSIQVMKIISPEFLTPYVQSVIVHSLLSVQHVVTHDSRCFELFGYDILLDASLKPWLLEVNASPSLSADTPMDSRLKSQMLDDCLTLLDTDRPLPQSEGGLGMQCKCIHPCRAFSDVAYQLQSRQSLFSFV